MNSKSQILTDYNASSNNYNFDNEKIHCTLTNLMIHNFLDALNIMDYENIIYSIALSQNFHPFNLFTDKHLETLNFQHCFTSNLDNFLKFFISTNILVEVTS
jgi:hypothetical protein